MSIKLTGQEFKKYYADPEAWPTGAYHDDVEITVDGVPRGPDSDCDLSEVPDAAVLVVIGGIIYASGDDREGSSLLTHLRRWRKKQNCAFLAVEVPRELLEAVKAAILAAGGKIKS